MASFKSKFKKCAFNYFEKILNIVEYKRESLPCDAASSIKTVKFQTYLFHQTTQK